MNDATWAVHRGARESDFEPKRGNPERWRGAEPRLAVQPGYRSRHRPRGTSHGRLRLRVTPPALARTRHHHRDCQRSAATATQCQEAHATDRTFAGRLGRTASTPRLSLSTCSRFLELRRAIIFVCDVASQKKTRKNFNHEIAAERYSRTVSKRRRVRTLCWQKDRARRRESGANSGEK